MIVDGVWNLIINPDGSKNPVKWNFHKRCKDIWRNMMDVDPDASGSAIDMLRDLEFDERLAKHEPGDKLLPNEEFLNKLFEDYNKKFNSYKPGVKERLLKDKSQNFFMSLYRNDMAYYERIEGIITAMIKNKERFNKDDCIEEIILIYHWWTRNDTRLRTAPWIDWVFRYLMNKYRTDEFYKKSINHCIKFMILNAHNWKETPQSNPDTWFGKGRGKNLVELNGGYF